jgi:DNA-binding transcriptional LysR family regulator
LSNQGHNVCSPRCEPISCSSPGLEKVSRQFSMTKKIDTTLLEIFVSAVDNKSLTRAGMELNLVVSAISKRIGELERYVGKSLLRRSGRGIEPTAAGELLYLHAKSILRSLQAADQALASFNDSGVRKIRLLANQTTIVQSLPQQIASYLSQTQDTSIDLIEGRSMDIPAAISAGEADVGIYHGQHPAAGVLSYPYRKDRMALIVPQGHPLQVRSSVYFEEVLDYPLLGVFPRYTLDQFLELAGPSLSRPPKVVLSVSNVEARCHMVKEGVGIAMVPEDIAMRYVANLGLGMIRINDSWAERQFFGCIRAADANDRYAHRLLHHLCSKRCVA